MPTTHENLCAIFADYFQATKELGEQLILIGGWGGTLASQSSEFPPKESVIDHVLQSAFADLEQWIPRTKQWITRTTPDPKIKVSTVDPDEAGLSRRISTSRNMSVSWNLHSNYQQYIEGLSV